METRVYFKRSGVEVATRYNGFRFIGCNGYTGRVGSAPCFDHLVVCNDSGTRFIVSEHDLGGPASVKVWSPGGPAEFFGVASEETLARQSQ